MKSSSHFPKRRTSHAELARRARILAVFDRSGLSAAAFARQHRLTYTTFCSWRQQSRRGGTKASPGFVQVELTAPAAAVELTIELGAQTRLRINSASQIALAIDLIQALNAKASC
jgi:transposase-like protein